MPPVSAPDVKAVFDSHPPALRKTLKELRKLVYEAAENADAGPLVETLKWGQISYLPETARVGTTVRLGARAKSDKSAVLFFHCQTTLLDLFRERYPGIFTFVGNRAIELDEDWTKHERELQHCVGLAFSYHRWKQR